MDAAEIFRRWMHHDEPATGPVAGPENMLERLRDGGVVDERVLAAMATVPREEVIDVALRRWPPTLADQRAPGGRLVVPVASGGEGEQLLRVRGDGEAFSVEELGPCRFVPLVGAEGYPDPEG